MHGWVVTGHDAISLVGLACQIEKKKWTQPTPNALVNWIRMTNSKTNFENG